MRISDWSSDVCSSDLQWDVVAALAEEFFSGEGARSIGRTVFAVGDLKQSIFSFQRADPEAFRRLRRHFNERVAAADAEWREIELDISFRSTTAVLRAVDAVFAASPACDGVVEDGAVLRHRAFRRSEEHTSELQSLMRNTYAV